MQKILKREEIGRLAELACDYQKANADTMIRIDFSNNYRDQSTVRLTIMDASYKDIGSREYLIEPDAATAAEAMSEIIGEAK